MRLGQDVLSDDRVALSLEWLLANGIGGCASGTVAALPQRAVHAHLVACGTHGRPLRMLLGMDERVRGPAGLFELREISAAKTPAAELEAFDRSPWPVWRYRVGNTRVEKTLFLIHRHHAVVIRYRHLLGDEVELIAAPLIGARPPACGAAEAVDAEVQAAPGRLHLQLGARRLSFHVWHDGVFMPARARRRVTHDLASGDEPAYAEALNVGHLVARLGAGASLNVIAAVEADLFRALAREDRLGAPPPRTLAECVTVLEKDERDRHEGDRREARAFANLTLRQAMEAHHAGIGAEPARLAPSDPFLELGAHALRAALVSRERRVTILASLPTALERGDATLRATQGLVTLRRFEAARAILASHAEYLNDGLAPSSFDPDDGTPRYEDPSVALWLAIAGERYVRRSDDGELARALLFPALEGMLHFYRSGTALGIRVDSEGLLLVAGEGGRAVARADLNALWYHAQIATAQLARAAGKKESGAFHLAWAHQHQRRFNEALWDDARGRLVDLEDGTPRDRGLIPAQVWAASLSPSILPPERGSRLIETIEAELWMPLGLRESAGSEWIAPEWLGAFHSAYLRAHGRSREAQAVVRERLAPLRERLETAAGGGLPERFRIDEDGGAHPSGDPLSVLAATELLRLWVEDLDHGN
jgi:hypothetical protein